MHYLHNAECTTLVGYCVEHTPRLGDHAPTCTPSVLAVIVVQVWTGLLVVDTSPAKAALRERGTALITALLDQLTHKSWQVIGGQAVACHICGQARLLAATMAAPMLLSR
jgi:hypothetical protein